MIGNVLIGKFSRDGHIYSFFNHYYEFFESSGRFLGKFYLCATRGYPSGNYLGIIFKGQKGSWDCLFLNANLCIEKGNKSYNSIDDIISDAYYEAGYSNGSFSEFNLFVSKIAKLGFDGFKFNHAPNEASYLIMKPIIEFIMKYDKSKLEYFVDQIVKDKSTFIYNLRLIKDVDNSLYIVLKKLLDKEDYPKFDSDEFFEDVLKVYDKEEILECPLSLEFEGFKRFFKDRKESIRNVAIRKATYSGFWRNYFWDTWDLDLAINVYKAISEDITAKCFFVDSPLLGFIIKNKITSKRSFSKNLWKSEYWPLYFSLIGDNPRLRKIAIKSILEYNNKLYLP